VMNPRPILTVLLFCCVVWGLALWFSCRLSGDIMTAIELAGIAALLIASWRSTDVCALVVVAIPYSVLVVALWRWCGK